MHKDHVLRALLLSLTLAVSAPGVARAGGGLDPAAVVARALPATVSIEVERAELRAPGLDELMGWARPSPAPAEAVATGTGSGVIVSPEGLVLTNHHVVAGAQAVRVTLSDRRTASARVLGSDPRTDVALLALEGEGPWPAARLGDSEALAVGDPVLTIGHPYDFAFTVTAGIVSARDRRNVSLDEIQDYIQIDAAVNPGASGGPLLDRQGDVVGITTAIYASAGEQERPPVGISFAVPIRLAWRVAQEIRDGRLPARPWVGLELEDGAEGVGVREVAAGGPAERAGLRAGDRIREVGGERIGSAAELGALLRSRAPGERLQLTVEREGRPLPLELTPVDLAGVRAGDAGAPVSLSWAGLSLEEELGGPDPHGPLVVAVTPGSPAALAGVRAGDRVAMAAGQVVTESAALRAAVDGRKAVVLGLWRRDGFVPAALIVP